MALPVYASPLERLWHRTYLVICTLIFIFLIAPILIVVPLSFNAEPYFTFTEKMLTFDPAGYSLRWYDTLLTLGHPAPETLKLCGTYDDGWRSVALIPITGIDALLGWGSLFLMLGLSVFLMVPVASAFSGLFLEDIADAVDDREKARRVQRCQHTVPSAAVQVDGLRAIGDKGAGGAGGAAVVRGHDHQKRVLRQRHEGLTALGVAFDQREVIGQGAGRGVEDRDQRRFGCRHSAHQRGG